jgi:hypothetical protein
MPGGAAIRRRWAAGDGFEFKIWFHSFQQAFFAFPVPFGWGLVARESENPGFMRVPAPRMRQIKNLF